MDRGHDDDLGCWDWHGALNKAKSGYGYLGLDGRLILAHRLSYEIAFGEIPAGLQVQHTCDNPRCVRPDHLYAGTQARNVSDMMMRRRRRYSLTPEVADEIRRMRAAGVSIHKTAKQLDIGVSAVKHCLAGRTWVEAA